MDLSQPVPLSRFSVLLPVYAAEEPGNLDQCLRSIEASSLPASQVVVVEDGPIGRGLRDMIERYRKTLPVTSVRLSRNCGLATALNAGLAACEYEYVARCDSDDINHPDRFMRELILMHAHPEVGVVGSDTVEFDARTGAEMPGRRLPSDPDALALYARRRNPLNHPSTVFRRELVMDVGGYNDFRGLEDYALWVKCLMHGVKLMNIPEPLVRMRSGQNQLQRRRGLDYARAELVLARHFYDSGFLDMKGYLFFLSSRIPVRLLPGHMVGWVYRGLLRRDAGHR